MPARGVPLQGSPAGMLVSTIGPDVKVIHAVDEHGLSRIKSIQMETIDEFSQEAEASRTRSRAAG